MTAKERRRYFRINELIGITYEAVRSDEDISSIPVTNDILSLVSDQDHKLEKLLLEVAKDHPKVAEIIEVFNQKIERIVNHIMLGNDLMGKLASRVQEANISACGIGFLNEERITEGTLLHLELTLFPSKQTLYTEGEVISCEPSGSGFYWRINYKGMSEGNQEILIQHVVQRQGAQLQAKRGEHL